MPRVGGSDIAEHLGPIVNLLAVVVRKTFGEIVRKIGFAGRTPGAGERSISGDQISPMGFGFLDFHPGHEISPRADEAWRDTLIDQMLQPAIDSIEILGPDV